MSAYQNMLQVPILNTDQGIRELREIARGRGSAVDLFKATQNVIGTPPDSANEFVAFMPQDVSRIFSAVTQGERQIVMSKRIAEIPVDSTQFFWPVQTNWGSQPNITAFASETSLTASRTGTAEQRSVNLKQHMDRRTLSITGGMVGMIGGINPMSVPQVSRNGLSRLLGDSIRAKRLMFERDLFHASSAVNPLEFDSIPYQIKSLGTADINKIDLRGEILTWETLLGGVAGLADQLSGAVTQEIVLTGAQWASLGAQASDHGRWMQGEAGTAGPTAHGWTYNPQRKGLVGPIDDQFVPLVVAPFLDALAQFPYSAASVGTPAQTVTNSDVTSIAAAGSGSQFTGDYVGTYIYSLMATFQNGSSAGFNTNSVAVTSGQEVTITMNDSAIGTADNPLLAYWVYRSLPDGAATTRQFLGRFPVKNVGGHTVIVDTNAVIPGTDDTLGLQYNDGAINLPTLLPATRFPLPLSTFGGWQHILLSIQAPKVWHWERQIVWTNCGRSSVSE